MRKYNNTWKVDVRIAGTPERDTVICDGTDPLGEMIAEIEKRKAQGKEYLGCKWARDYGYGTNDTALIAFFDRR